MSENEIPEHLRHDQAIAEVEATCALMQRQMQGFGEAATTAEQLGIVNEFGQRVTNLRERHGLREVRVSIGDGLSQLAQSLGIDVRDIKQHAFQLNDEEILILRERGEVPLFNRYADHWGCETIRE